MQRIREILSKHALDSGDVKLGFVGVETLNLDAGAWDSQEGKITGSKEISDSDYIRSSCWSNEKCSIYVLVCGDTLPMTVLQATLSG